MSHIAARAEVRALISAIRKPAAVVAQPVQTAMEPAA